MNAISDAIDDLEREVDLVVELVAGQRGRELARTIGGCDESGADGQG